MFILKNKIRWEITKSFEVTQQIIKISDLSFYALSH